MPTKGGPLTGDYELPKARREYRDGVKATLKTKNDVRKRVDKIKDALENFASSVEVHSDWLIGQEVRTAKQSGFEPETMLNRLYKVIDQNIISDTAREHGYTAVPFIDESPLFKEFFNSIYGYSLDKECPFCDYKGGRFDSGKCPKCDTYRDDFLAAHPEFEQEYTR